MKKASPSFPRWFAPLVGAVFCGFASAKAAAKDQRLAEPKWILLGIALGAAAGCLVFIADRKTSSPTAKDDPGTVMSRVMAMISIPAIVVPLMNVAVSGVSLHMNWEVRGWPKILSWISLLISALLSSVMLVAVLANQ